VFLKLGHIVLRRLNEHILSHFLIGEQNNLAFLLAFFLIDFILFYFLLGFISFYYLYFVLPNKGKEKNLRKFVVEGEKYISFGLIF
jgi:predicted membrane protein